MTKDRLSCFCNPRTSIVGRVGTTGARGITGAAGTQGIQGEPGADADDGSGGGGGPQAWPTLFGTGDPNGSITPDGIGQWFKDTASGDTWVNQDGTITGWI